VTEVWHQAAFRNAFLMRGAAVWVMVRMFMAFARLLDPNLAAEALLLLLVGGLVAWDARRRNEDLFLANLGVPLWAIVLVGSLGALPLEVIAP
jgi:hypothetical protein